MSRSIGWCAAALAAAVAVGCKAPPNGPDGHEALSAALTGAARARGCAAELWRAAEVDPGATATLLGVEPATLAPWGGAARGAAAVREAILARAASAQDAARAARSLALLGAYASAEQEALRREKIARSLADSSALCRAADGARGGLLAQRREP
jgi:DNA-binding transcriptional regulator YdaS (Cro superfamily)